MLRCRRKSGFGVRLLRLRRHLNLSHSTEQTPEAILEPLLKPKMINWLITGQGMGWNGYFGDQSASTSD